MESVKALGFPASGLSLQRCRPPLLARISNFLVWRGRKQTFTAFCITLETWDKQHFSALSSLTYRAQCHSSMFQMSLKKLVGQKHLATLQGRTWHCHTCFRKLHMVSIKWTSPHKYLENVTINLQLSQDMNLGWPICVVPSNPLLPHKTGWMVWEIMDLSVNHKSTGCSVWRIWGMDFRK